MSETWSPVERRQVPYRRGDFETYYAALLARLHGQRVAGSSAPPLQGLHLGDGSDWLVAVSGAWAELAEIFTFYQERIINEVFLGTATRTASVDRIYHSLGHVFTPNTAAVTQISYNLKDTASGMDALGRARGAGTGSLRAPGSTAPASPTAAAGGTSGGSPASAAGGVPGVLPPGSLSAGAAGSGIPGAGPTAPAGAGGSPSASPGGRRGRRPGTAGTTSPPATGTGSTVPQAAQLRALPSSGSLPPDFLTLESIDAYVGASQLPAVTSSSPPPAELTGASTQLVLATTRSGLAPGQPIVITGRELGSGSPQRWARQVVAVTPDSSAGTTRVAWSGALAPGSSADDVVVVNDPVVYTFAKSATLLGYDAATWSSLPLASQLSAPTGTGSPVVPLGGVLSSADGGQSWTPAAPGLPSGTVPASVYAGPGVVVVGASSGGIFVSSGSAPFSAASASGASQGVLFVGGTSAQLLAGTTQGSVLQSFDDGRTWSAVRGGPPTLQQDQSKPSTARRVGKAITAAVKVAASFVPGLKTVSQDASNIASPADSSQPSAAAQAAATQVVAHQLPSAPVRAVLASGGNMLAGTDAGAYHFDGTDWAADGLTTAVFALLDMGSSVLAATASGVSERTTSGSKGTATWASFGSGLSGRVYALAAASGTTYAATDLGVMALSASGEWDAVNGSGPSVLPAAPVPSLVATGTTLVAGTGAGIYRSEDGGSSWQRCDSEVLFDVPSSDVPAGSSPGSPPAPGPVPPALAASFADGGIRLSTSATFTPGTPTTPATAAGGSGDASSNLTVVGTVVDADGTYQLTSGSQPAGGGQGASGSTSVAVWRTAALGAVYGLGLTGTTVVAAAAVGGSSANEWPGFEVEGTSLQLSSTVNQVAADSIAVLTQTAEGNDLALVLDLTDTAVEALDRFGKKARATVLTAAESVPYGEFDRRSCTVWVQSAARSLSPPPSTAADVVSGSTLTVKGGPAATVPQGRSALVTGKPVSLVLAPLGGAFQQSGTSFTALGPCDADATGIVQDPTGRVLLATAEGVFLVTGGTVPTLLADGWPQSPANAVAQAATSGGEVTLAATNDGCEALVWAADGSAQWCPAGLAGVPVVALAGGDLVLAARGSAQPATSQLYATGTAIGAPVPADGSGTASWSALPPLAGSVVALATAGARGWAASEKGVFELDNGQWTALPDLGTSALCLAADDSGTLWAGTPQGVRKLGVSGTWASATGIPLATPVQAIETSGTDVVAASPTGLYRSSGGAPFSAVTGTEGVLVGGLTVPTGGGLLVAARAALPVLSSAGQVVAMVAQALAFAGPYAGPLDVATLDQGGIPTDLADAFSDHSIDVTKGTWAVEALVAGQCWRLSSGEQGWVVASRALVGGQVLNVYSQSVAVSVLGAAVASGAADAWPVDVASGSGTLTARPEVARTCPSGSSSPSLAETGVLAASVPPVPTAAAAGSSSGAAVGATSAAAGSASGAAASGASSSTGTTSTLQLTAPLRHLYDATTVVVNLNVVSAVQGRQTTRVIGSGNSQVPNQSFVVPTPVAVVPADAAAATSPTGSWVSSLKVFVGGEPWSEVPTLKSASPTARSYVTETNKDGTVTVTFGDGQNGSRLPTGQSNVVATYIEGGGPAGDVGAGTIVQPLTRPQLVSSVHNPIPASRPPAPHPVKSATASSRTLGRAVSLEDYAEIAVMQDSVASAAAELVDTATGRTVVVTVATAAGAPADPTSAVSEAIALSAARTASFTVVVAHVVLVAVTLDVVGAGEDLATTVAGALAGLGAPRPAAPFAAASVLAVASGVAGVDGATLRAWGPAGQDASAVRVLRARGARWDAASGKARPAELLVLGSAPGAVTVTVRPPRPEAPR